MSYFREYTHNQTARSSAAHACGGADSRALDCTAGNFHRTARSAFK